MWGKSLHPQLPTPPTGELIIIAAMEPIYLDNNATTPLLPEVLDAMREAYAQGYANPASQHAAGRRARAALEQARDAIGALLGADLSSFQADRVIFTSGGTESNNLALRGLAGRPPGRILISAIEHPSVSDTADFLATQGFTVARLPVNRQGVIELSAVEQALDPAAKREGEVTRLLSAMLGNNETGVLQPIAEIAALCATAGVLIHTDAVQVVGKLPVDFRTLGINALSCAAHKFHGPRGIGVLLVRYGVDLEPQLFGGFQQAGLRPGTEPVVLAIGMQRALQLWHRERTERAAQLAALRDRLASQLRAGWPELVIHGESTSRLPQTLSVSFPGLDRQRLLMALDLAGVACSTGSACASGSSASSPVLLAMGLETSLVDSSLRFSLGCQNGAAEVDQAARRILKVCNDLRSRERGRNLPEASPAPPRKPL